VFTPTKKRWRSQREQLKCNRVCWVPIEESTGVKLS
jgi:hypothetical protein